MIMFGNQGWGPTGYIGAVLHDVKSNWESFRGGALSNAACPDHRLYVKIN